MVKIEVPDEYPYIVLCLIILSFMCVVTGYAVTIPARMKYFNKEFLSQFEKEHKLAFGPETKLSDGGYPDIGNGRYANKLEYLDWYSFNNSVRTH